MKNDTITTNYTITYDQNFLNELHGITPEIGEIIETLKFQISQKPSLKTIEKLNQLILKYPFVPEFKMILSIVYFEFGKHEKAAENMQLIYNEHFDHFQIKLIMANDFIKEGKYEKVTEILGENFDLNVLYPTRKIFHVNEIAGIMSASVRYFAAKGELDVAENRLQFLKKIAPNHPDTELAEESLGIINASDEAICEDDFNEDENHIYIHQIKMAEFNKNSIAPRFNHVEVLYLYDYAFEIPEDILNSIIALPRTTLIADLEAVIQDAIDRNGFFNELEHSPETHSFVAHAFFILKEIDAKESLPKLLAFLEYDYNFIDYWIGDEVRFSIWQCFFVLGENQLEVLNQFLLLPGVDGNSKEIVVDALIQLSLKNSKLKKEVIVIITDVFEKMLNAKIEDNFIDTEFIEVTIREIIYSHFKELLPIIKKLYDNNVVASYLYQDYDSVVEEIALTKNSDYQAAIQSINELYTIFRDNLNSEDYGWEEDEEDDFPYYQEPFKQAVSEKIERNAPCPCGSGKKYKKCCLKN